MSSQNKRKAISLSIVIVMMLTAFSCKMIVFADESFRHIEFNGVFLNDIIFILRTMIYFVLFVWWGISVQRRIVHTQTQKLMLCLVIMMIFWMLIRTIKYEFLTDINLIRYFWYLYYIPILFIPTIAFYIALFCGKSENYKLPTQSIVLVIVTVVLVLLVLANDFHQLSFVFPDNQPWSDKNYTYGPVYFLCVIWFVAMVIGTISILIKKCHIPRSRKFLYTPFIPTIGLLLYIAIYPILNYFNILNLILNDFIVIENLFCIAILECCIQCGLIQSNNCYEELFKASTSANMITDENLVQKYRSESFPYISKEILKSAVKSNVELSDEKRLCSAKIKNGYVFYIGDVSKINKLLRDLCSVKESLQGENDLLAAENELKKNQARVETLTALYTEITNEVSDQLRQIDELLASVLPTAPDFNKIMAKVCVLGAYIKRRGNMILLSDESSDISVSELKYCIGDVSFRI